MKYRGRFILLFLSLASAWIYLIVGNVEVIPFTIFTLIHVVFHGLSEVGMTSIGTYPITIP